jgi:hypothetical protein
MPRPKFVLKSAYTLTELCETLGWSERFVIRLVESGRLARRDDGMFDTAVVRDAILRLTLLNGKPPEED